ncbi:MAG: hypothetical protein AABY22_18150 [Nanoarchaeota archaeon]
MGIENITILAKEIAIVAACDTCSAMTNEPKILYSIGDNGPDFMTAAMGAAEVHNKHFPTHRVIVFESKIPN